MNDPNVFDPKLIQRLNRPLVKPGVINLGMARGIILRSQSFVNRLPLLAIAQRHYNIAESKTEQLPIVYAQSRLPQAEIGSNLSLQGDRQVSQSNPSQTTVVQAKLASPTSPTTTNVNTQVVNQSENTSNSLPLVTSLPSDSANSESIPIVYAKSQSPETVTARDISLQHNVNRQNAENNDNQTTIVQAKFASPTSPTTTNVNPQVINQSENTSNSLPLVTSLPSDSANSESIPIVYAKSQSPETVTANDISLQPNVNILNPQSNDSQTRVVQAKFASPTAPTTTDVNPQVVNQSVVTQPQNQTNSLPLVSPLPLINSTPDDKGQNLTPQPPSLRGKG
ncbi:MAG TPA: hypothetical protein DD000_04435, partial [Cyanobacteria bacterium UBA11166]|nr:hypothetical protein [Cyanobacteria bacterium UBA11166]